MQQQRRICNGIKEQGYDAVLRQSERMQEINSH